MPQGGKTGDAAPDDLVIVGHISGAHGIQGWVRIRPWSQDAETLLTAREWWLDKPELHQTSAQRTRVHGDEILARLSTVKTREEAEAAKGTAIRVSRSLFPALEEDEFYWVDLIGMDVINHAGEKLGTVFDLMDNGVHQVLRVEAEKDEASGKRREILIPFVREFVGDIDQSAKTIRVDWEADY